MSGNVRWFSSTQEGDGEEVHFSNDGMEIGPLVTDSNVGFYFYGLSIVSLFTMITSLCWAFLGADDPYSSPLNDDFDEITSNTCKNIILEAQSLIVRRVQALTTSKNEKFIGGTRCTGRTGFNFDCDDGTQGSGRTTSSFGVINDKLDELESIDGELKAFGDIGSLVDALISINFIIDVGNGTRLFSDTLINFMYFMMIIHIIMIKIGIYLHTMDILYPNIFIMFSTCTIIYCFFTLSIMSLFTMITSLFGALFAVVNPYLSLFNDSFDTITSKTSKNIIIGAQSSIVRRVPALTTSTNEKFIGGTRCTGRTGFNFDCSDSTQGSGSTTSSIGVINDTLDGLGPVGGELKVFGDIDALLGVLICIDFIMDIGIGTRLFSNNLINYTYFMMIINIIMIKTKVYWHRMDILYENIFIMFSTCSMNYYFYGLSFISLFAMIASVFWAILHAVNQYSSLFNDDFNIITSGTRKNIIIGAQSLIVRRVPALTTSKNEKFIGGTRCTGRTGFNFDCNGSTQGSGDTTSLISVINDKLDKLTAIGGELKAFGVVNGLSSIIYDSSCFGVCLF